MDEQLATSLSGALGSPVRAAHRVYGGDVATSWCVDLVDGRRVFAKTHRHPPPGFFATEASGLQWIAAAGAVDVPTVLAFADDPPAFLALSWIDTGSATPTTEADLGRALAALHRSGAPVFGRQDRHTTGSLGLPNDPTPSWTTFYASCRLEPLARIAHERGALGEATIDRLATVAARLEHHAGPAEPPARLHGDLWAGNRLVGARGGSWLIDPAAHGGHREFDLAMMRLFGGFRTDCFAAYDEEYPLSAGWAERIALHQIAPLVVHAIKFGGSYVSRADAAIAHYSSLRGTRGRG